MCNGIDTSTEKQFDFGSVPWKIISGGVFNVVRSQNATGRGQISKLIAMNHYFSFQGFQSVMVT